MAFGHEVFIINEFHASIVILDDSGEALHPIARVQVSDLADLLVLWGVDMAANDAVAVLVDGEFLEELLIFIDEADGGFHLSFHSLTKGEIFLTTPYAPAVVVAINGQQGVVANGTKRGEPPVIRRDAIEAIAVHNEVAELICGDVDVLFEETDFAEGER